MTLIDIMRTATRPIRTRSLESALIVVAVALGVGVVTAMLALILNGLEQERAFTQSIAAQELVMVSRNDNFQGFSIDGSTSPLMKLGKASDKPAKLEESDLRTVLKACPSLRYAYLNDFFFIREAPNKDDPSRANEVQMLAVTKSYIEAAKLTLLAGAWPTSREFENRSKVIAISEWFARQRFGQTAKPVSTTDQKEAKAIPSKLTPTSTPEKPFRLQDVIGKVIFSQSSVYTIAAVFATPSGFDYANDQNRFGARGIVPWGIQDFMQLEVGQLKFLAQEGQFDAAREQLRTYADRRFGQAVVINAAKDQIAASLSVSRNAALVTALFASGGLVIAALNITNLMLARVLGRTRSIGISSALGASSRTIFTLFLTESLLLGLLGGLLGIAMARGITAGLEYALKNTQQGFQTPGINLNLEPTHFGLGLLVAFGISLLFGAYPAWMASRIRPSEALRG
jgi:ABC-type antimicrobial peptide transport system permease subunit